MMARREVEDGANHPDMTACRNATTCHWLLRHRIKCGMVFACKELFGRHGFHMCIISSHLSHNSFCN